MLLLYFILGTFCFRCWSGQWLGETRRCHRICDITAIECISQTWAYIRPADATRWQSRSIIRWI